MITISCAQCETKHKLSESLAGKKIRCKKCGATLAIPYEDEPPPDELAALERDELRAAEARSQKPKRPLPSPAQNVEKSQGSVKPNGSQKVLSSAVKVAALAIIGLIAWNRYQAFVVWNWRLQPQTQTREVVTSSPPNATEQNPITSEVPPTIDSPNDLDLIEQIDPRKHKIVGDWVKQDHSLTSPYGVSVLELPFAPTPDYELEFEVERLGDEVECINVGFPVGNNRTACTIDGYKGERSGLVRIDGIFYADNPAVLRSKLIKPGKNRIKITVHPQSVEVEVNSQKIVDWKGDPARLGPGPAWREAGERAFLSTWTAQYKVTRATLRKL